MTLHSLKVGSIQRRAGCLKETRNTVLSRLGKNMHIASISGDSPLSELKMKMEKEVGESGRVGEMSSAQKPRTNGHLVRCCTQILASDG